MTPRRPGHYRRDPSHTPIRNCPAASCPWTVLAQRRGQAIEGEQILGIKDAAWESAACAVGDQNAGEDHRACGGAAVIAAALEGPCGDPLARRKTATQ